MSDEKSGEVDEEMIASRDALTARYGAAPDDVAAVAESGDEYDPRPGPGMTGLEVKVVGRSAVGRCGWPGLWALEGPETPGGADVAPEMTGSSLCRQDHDRTDANAFRQ